MTSGQSGPLAAAAADQAQQTPDDLSTLAKGVGVALVGRVLGRGLHLLGQVAIARLLDPVGYGMYALGWTILRVAGFFTPLGLDNAVLHFGAKFRRYHVARFKRLIVQGQRVAVLSGFLVGVLFYATAPFLAVDVFRNDELLPIFRGLAAAFPFVSGLLVSAATTRVSQRLQFSVMAEDIGQPLILLLLLALLVPLGLTLQGVILALVLSFAGAFGLALYFIKRLFADVLSVHQAHDLSTGRLLLFSIPTALSGVFFSLIFWADRLFMGYFRPLEEVGIYVAASQMALLFAVILSACNAAFAPMIADLYHRNALDRMAVVFRTSTRWGLYISLPLFITIWFYPAEILTAIFGHEYSGGGRALQILTVGQFANIGSGPLGYLLIMTGRQNIWLVVTGLAFLANISLNLLLIPRLGLAGAALATSGAIAALFLVGLFTVHRSLALWPYDRRCLKGLAAAAATIVVLQAQQSLHIATPLPCFVLAAVLSFTAFWATVLLLGLDAEDRMLIQMIKRRIAPTANRRAQKR